MADVVVVGAGIGGLAAAIELAARGHAVTVLEAEARAGGKAGVVTIDGVELDTGPSLLTLVHVFEALFERAGARLRDEIELVPLEPAFDYRWPDGTRLVTGHRYEATRAAVADAFGAHAARELDAFAGHAKKIWDAAWPTFVAAEAPKKRDLLKPSAWRTMVAVDPLRTMQAAIDAHVATPPLRDVLYRYATYNGSDPRRSPATLCCIAHVDLSEGGWGVRGGIAALVDAMQRVGDRLGVAYRFDARVERIEVRGGVARGVTLESGERLAADAVVMNADVSALDGLLARPLELGGAEPSMSAWNGILKRRGAPLAPHTVLFPRRYLDEFRDIFDRDRPPEDPAVYLCAPDVAHGRSGWGDGTPAFVMANAPAEPARGARDPKVFEALRERVLERLRGAGLMEEGDALVWERTPTDLARRFPGSRGALYGAASTSRMAAFARPSNRVARVRGLYLASGSAHPGGGMPLCALSGRAVTEALTADLGGGDLARTA